METVGKIIFPIMIKHRTRTSRIPFFFDIHDGRLFRPVLKIRRSQMPNAMRAASPTAVVVVSIVQIQQMIYAFVIKIHHVACPRIVSARRIEVNGFFHLIHHDFFASLLQVICKRNFQRSINKRQVFLVFCKRSKRIIVIFFFAFVNPTDFYTVVICIHFLLGCVEQIQN